MEYDNAVCEDSNFDVARPRPPVTVSSEDDSKQTASVSAHRESTTNSKNSGLGLAVGDRDYSTHSSLSVKSNVDNITKNIGNTAEVNNDIKNVNLSASGSEVDDIDDAAQRSGTEGSESKTTDAVIPTYGATSSSNADIDLPSPHTNGGLNPHENQTLDRFLERNCENRVTINPGQDNNENMDEIKVNDQKDKTFSTDLNTSHNKMPFGLCSNKESLDYIEDDDENDEKSDSSVDNENETFKEPKIIDLGGIEIPEMMSPKSRIDYINDMRKQLGNLITKGPSIVATNLLHGVSEPPIGSPKDKATVAADIDTWEVLTPTSSVSSYTAELKSFTNDQALHGTLTREGQMVSFVADDIMEKIRQSASPMASSRGSPSSCRTASGPDTPLILSRAESFSRNAIPPIDPAVITDIEKNCKRVADSLDLMLGNLTGSIHNMSAITVGHIQTYKDAADKVGFTVDESVKAMYSLMAKCEQLNKMMQPVKELAQQIKGIKQLLDELESKCK